MKRPVYKDTLTGDLRTSDGQVVAVGAAAPPPATSQFAYTTPVGDVDGVNTVFTIDPSPIGLPISTFNCLVFVNGALQAEGVDFTFTDGATITFTAAPAADSSILAVLIGTPKPPTTTPPAPPDGAGNILANGDFSSGDDGWSKTPPSDWEAFPWVIASHEVDVDAASARVYLGHRTNKTAFGDAPSGLVYVGDEWVPDLFSKWLLSFEWRRIAEVDTNHAPYGLALTAPLGVEWGAREHFAPFGAGGAGGFFWPTSAADALTWQRASIELLAEPNNTLPGWVAGGPWQFAITGAGAWCSPAASVTNTTYGFGFEVRNVSLEPYNV